MSPAQHSPQRPPRASPATDNQFASSNLTANRFLGASRKPWMTAVPSYLLGPVSEPRKYASPYPRASIVVNAHEEHPNPSPKRERTALPSSIASQRSSTLPQAPSGSNTSPTTSNRASEQTPAHLAQVTPVSPSTPGATQPESTVNFVADASQKASHALTPQKGAFGPPGSDINFPSPGPSIGSHTSPVGVTERRQTVKDLPGKAISIPEGKRATYSNGKEAQTANGARMPFRVPSMGSFSNWANAQAQSKPSQPYLPPLKTASPLGDSRERFWKIARESLRSFLTIMTKNCALSDTVELPRLRILQDVCIAKDMFYIALHQIFCLDSYYPSSLHPLAKYGIKPGLGFDVIAQLLVDNKRLSADFVNWSITYPLPLESMLENEDYTLALTQVGECLNTLSKNWSVLEKDLRARGHPPQVDELVMRLGIVSPVFQTITFTAVSRRLFGPREEPFKACMSLFEDDQKTYQQRCASSDSVRRQAMYHYFERYKKICAFHGIPQQSHGANVPGASAQLPTATGPAKQPRPPQLQHAPSANRSRPSTTNSSLNMHPPNIYSGPPNHRQNYHVSPSMVANNRPQQQQPPYQNNAHHFPRPPTHSMISSQGNAPPLNAPPNQMPPPNFHVIQYLPSHPGQGSNGAAANGGYFPPHVRQSSNGTPVPMGAPSHAPPHMIKNPKGMPLSTGAPAIGGDITARTVRDVQYSFPHAFPMAQPPPQPGAQGHRPAQPSSYQEQSPDIIQYFAEFAIPAQKLPPNRCAFNWKFPVSAEMLRRRSRLVPQSNGRGHIPALADGDVAYRLRCVRYEGKFELDSITSWSQAQSCWPDVVYIHVNDIEVYRPQDSKNLPLSINSHLKEGLNQIRLNFLHASGQRTRKYTYAVAVEVLQVKSPRSFKGMIQSLSVQESRKQIQNRLSLSNKDDDDLMIMDDFISIDLRDPFTTRIFEVPARGLLCTHRECFDLPTFLQTLSTKPLAGKRAIYLKCPICRKDARPNLLVIDTFLVEVRSALSQQQKLETAKAIRVKSDGSWEAVLEVDSDVKTSSRKRDRTSFEADLVKMESPQASPLRAAPPAPEIIELD